MTQSNFGGTPNALITMSPSSIGRWLDCPRMYRLQDVERRRSTLAWAHFSLGNAVHAALRDWFDRPLTQRTPDSARSLLRQHWTSDGFRDREQSEQIQGRTSDELAAYVATVDPTGEPLSRERGVALTTSHATIRGRVDRLDERVDEEGEHVVVVDYKTSRRPLGPDDARTSMALALYVAGVRRTLKRRSYRVELHHVPTAQVVSHDYDDSGLARQMTRVDAITADVSRALNQAQPLARAAQAGELDAHEQLDALFPARPGPLCRWCSMRPWCPDGDAMGPLHQPWDAVVADGEGSGAEG